MNSAVIERPLEVEKFEEEETSQNGVYVVKMAGEAYLAMNVTVPTIGPANFLAVFELYGDAQEASRQNRGERVKPQTVDECLDLAKKRDLDGIAFQREGKTVDWMWVR